MSETNNQETKKRISKKTILKIIIVIIIVILALIGYQQLSASRAETVAEAYEMNSIEVNYFEQQQKAEQEKQELIQKSIKKYVTANRGLNIRGKDWQIIGTLSKGSEVTVLIEKYTESQDWDLVLYNDTYAYMSNKYLSIEKPITTTQTTKNSTKTVQNSSSVVTNSTTGMKYLGTFTTTAYCNCSRCCGKWAGGPTASGVMPQAGRTIAVDPKVIPLGSKVIINGQTYIAEDTGSAIKGKKIDIYFSSHSAANAYGRKSVEVYLAA